MTDMTRPPGDHTPDDAPHAPDTREESALDTGRRPTAPVTDHDMARDPDLDRGATRATDLPGPDRHGTDRHATSDSDRHGTDLPATDRHGTDRHGTDRHGSSDSGLPATDRHGTLDSDRHSSHDTDRLAAEAPRDDHRTTPDKAGPAKNRAHLLAHDDLDKLGAQLHHAVAGFVDGPRAAVEEADHVLEEIAARFTEAVTQRRRTLRHSWQSVEGGEGRDARSVSSADTEQLRLALKDYRELAERLLHV
ncbi:hypothetical protein [Streptomyces sp. NPDC007984]|uniref:hypothetical protein n=1 Tax=Streptomyces sp. NPDC007984 TaxID=3364801 RepID=UPI0036EA61E8